MASLARSDAKHAPQKKTCFRHRVQRRFRSFGIGQLCWDAEDVRETLSLTGKVQEQFIGASDLFGARKKRAIVRLGRERYDEARGL